MKEINCIWHSIDEGFPIGNINKIGACYEYLCLTDKGTYLILLADYSINSKGSPWVYKNGKRIPHTVKVKYWMELPKAPEKFIYNLHEYDHDYIEQ